MLNNYSYQQSYNVNRNLSENSQQLQYQSQYTSSSLQWSPPPPPISLSQSHYQQMHSQPHNNHVDFYTRLLPQKTIVDKEVLKEIKRKSDLYETAKEQIITRIKSDFESVINKIKETENKVLDDVGKELGENPFSTLLARIYSGKNTTDAEIKNVLSKEIPQNFGPNKEMFQNIYKEIEVFNSHLRKKDDKFSNITVLPDCTWKYCPYDIDDVRKYSTDENNTRIATKLNNNKYYCTIIGNVSLPLNKVVGWNVKILQSFYNGGSILIGVASSNINQNSDDNLSNGWFFHCGDSTLYSGPPQNYRKRKYGSGGNVKTGDTVGVVMDTTSGELSFIVGGVNYGASYTRIPLNRPLSPCVLLYYGGDSVELVLSKVKENVDSSIPVPSEIKTKNITWDSITLTWSKIDGASFYQVEVDGSNKWDISTETSFTKTSLHPDSEHGFKIRTVKGNSVSEWSDLVKGRTQIMAFETSGWKECPGEIDKKKYLLESENPRIVKMVETGYCTVIGNTPIPMNGVTSWSIKIINSENNDGDGIFIGIAPFDITQNDDENNLGKCGWYFDCFESKVIDLNGEKHYGPERGKGQYVKAGDKISVVMDLRKNELSFYLNGVNYGAAFEGIPINKPLVPCVILRKKGNSVELYPSEVKEFIDSSIPVPKLKVKDVTWNSISLTWKEDKGASFYQVEIDGSKTWDASTIGTFTKRGLLEETEHTFMVRAVKGNAVSEWSSVVKGKTAEKPWECVWKECPDNVEEKLKYSVDEDNPRIVRKIGDVYLCTIIGNTPLPLNKVTSLNIKILKSRNNSGNGIFIGVAPFDINQNEWINFNKCGWYFNCHYSTLYSGPPHNYKTKEYGPRKEDGQYIHNEDSVGVVIDTTKGELSFVVNEVNLGIAYEGITLDKPLVPCVLLGYGGDSVELVI